MNGITLTWRSWSTTATCVAGLTTSLFAAAIVTPALADAETFRANCAKCHSRAATIARQIKGDTPDQRKAQLETFLTTHHAEDPAVRERIATYLLTLTAK
jgi:mono/diheme cytochrome c family protein